MLRVSIPQTADGQDVSPGFIGPAHAPELGEAAMAFSHAVYAHSRLSLREFEGARMMTALINGCIMCKGWRSAVDLPAYLGAIGGSANSRVLDHPGDEPDETFYQTIGEWRGSDIYSPRERIAIELAERMGKEPQSIAADDDFWQRAKAVFSDSELVDLGYSIACWIGTGRVAHVFGMDTICSLSEMREANAAHPREAVPAE